MKLIFDYKQYTPSVVEHIYYSSLDNQQTIILFNSH